MTSGFCKAMFSALLACAGVVAVELHGERVDLHEVPWGLWFAACIA